MAYAKPTGTVSKDSGGIQIMKFSNTSDETKNNFSLKCPNVKILEKLDLAIEDAKKNKDDMEKVEKEVEMLQQMKKDLNE